MELFKQLWNGYWHFETPTNETIRWMADCGLGEMICLAIVTLPFLFAFLGYMKYLGWKHIVLPERRFERRHNIVVLTEDCSVYSLSDKELDRYESELDF